MRKHLSVRANANLVTNSIGRNRVLLVSLLCSGGFCMQGSLISSGILDSTFLGDMCSIPEISRPIRDKLLTLTRTELRMGKLFENYTNC